MKKFALGVDIGGTNSKFGLVDAEGELHYSNSIKTNTAATPTRLVNAIYQEIKEKTNFIDEIAFEHHSTYFYKIVPIHILSPMY